MQCSGAVALFKASLLCCQTTKIGVDAVREISQELWLMGWMVGLCTPVQWLAMIRSYQEAIGYLQVPPFIVIDVNSCSSWDEFDEIVLCHRTIEVVWRCRQLYLRKASPHSMSEMPPAEVDFGIPHL